MITIKCRMLTTIAHIRMFVHCFKVDVSNSLRIFWNRSTKKSRMGQQFPKEINICGILFSVSEHEGIIVFSQLISCWGTHNRLSFHRPKFGLWEFNFSDSSGDCPACHVFEAYKLVCEYRGDNFGRDLAVDGSL